MTEPGSWTIRVDVPDAAAVPVLEVAIADLIAAVSVQHDERAGIWRLTGYSAERPDRSAVVRSLAAAARAAGIAIPAIAISRLPATDWIAEQERALPALDIGHFRVFGSHVTDPVPVGHVPVRIDAGLAFGTGHHESTAGCLVAIDRLYCDGRSPPRTLDIGTGSGILGIAIARWLDGPVIATDIDPVAVRVANANARINEVSDRFSALVADGLGNDEVVRNQPYGLIVANIFERQLIDLAPLVAPALAVDGHVVLSGLQAESADRVADAFAAAGIACIDRVELSGWTTLVGAQVR